MMNGCLVEEIFAGPTVIVHSEDMKKRRFSGAGRAHHRNELALRNFNVDVTQHVKKSALRQRIRTLEIVKLDHTHPSQAAAATRPPAVKKQRCVATPLFSKAWLRSR